MIASTQLRLRRLSWIVFLAIFGVVFAPTLSNAAATWRADGGYWDVLCSDDGVHSALDDESRAPLDLAAGVLHHLRHCPMCGLATVAMAPPSSLAVLSWPGRDVLVGARPPAVAPAIWRCDAQPRAPPCET